MLGGVAGTVSWHETLVSASQVHQNVVIKQPSDRAATRVTAADRPSQPVAIQAMAVVALANSDDDNTRMPIRSVPPLPR